MGVMFVQMSRSKSKIDLRGVSTDRALLYIARRRGTSSPEQLAQLEDRVRRGEFVLYSGYFNDIRTRNLPAFHTIGELLRDRESNSGKLRQKLTIETEKELRCWSKVVAKLQELTDYFHPAHLLQPDLDPEFRSLQLGYLYLAILGQRTHHQQQGLLDNQGKASTLLLERIHHATRESALSPYLDSSSAPFWQLTALPEEAWERGVIQSIFLDYLTDSLVLAASRSGFTDSSNHLVGFSELEANPSPYIQAQLDILGRQLDRLQEPVR